MWSPVEKTALAEAEVEYEDIVSTQIDVAFEIVESPIPELVGAHAVIWTTTPWTIPVNQAIAYGPDVEYRLWCEDGGIASLRGGPRLISRRRSSEQRTAAPDRRQPGIPARDDGGSCTGQRPRRHRRPPPDARARRLLRQAPPLPARRLRHHRRRHRPRPHGARPWRGRFPAVQGERHRSGLRGRRRRQLSRRLGVARRPGHR